MLERLYAVFEWFHMIRNLKAITDLATMSDAEFARRTPELKRHPNVEFRALCSIRDTNIEFPGEPRWKYSVVAYQRWGQQGRYISFDNSFERLNACCEPRSERQSRSAA